MKVIKRSVILCLKITTLFYFEMIYLFNERNCFFNVFVIENQFGDADHDHLGKILTYAATLEADILIWISENFRREHINALNWLNTIAKSYNSPSFFALKIELIKIEDSKPALSITPIVQPPNWSNQNKTAGITRNRNKKEKQYHEFWSQFIPYFDSVKSGFKNKKPPYHSWISFPSPSSKMHYSIYFESGKYPTIALYISGGTAEENKNFFEKIKTHQAELKSKFPDLDWYDLPKNKSKSIDLYRKEEYDFSEEKRDDVMNWLKQNIQEFEKAFNPIIKNL